MTGGDADMTASPDNTGDRAREARPNTWPWPPILYVVTPLLAYGLHWFWPLAAVAAAPIDRFLGWPLFVLGICFGLVAIIRFRIVGTAIDPTARAKALATGGIYQFSRNPMYLGVVIAYFGLGLALAWSWLIVLDLILPFVLTKLAIEREEAYLELRFGDAYRAYKAKVRRWL
jgi:protein-S-isoprenylcysteine O-methyltransferase Ste14